MGGGRNAGQETKKSGQDGARGPQRVRPYRPSRIHRTCSHRTVGTRAPYPVLQSQGGGQGTTTAHCRPAREDHPAGPPADAGWPVAAAAWRATSARDGHPPPCAARGWIYVRPRRGMGLTMTAGRWCDEAGRGYAGATLGVGVRAAGRGWCCGSSSGKAVVSAAALPPAAPSSAAPCTRPITPAARPRGGGTLVERGQREVAHPPLPLVPPTWLPRRVSFVVPPSQPLTTRREADASVGGSPSPRDRGGWAASVRSEEGEGRRVGGVRVGVGKSPSAWDRCGGGGGDGGGGVAGGGEGGVRPPLARTASAPPAGQGGCRSSALATGMRGGGVACLRSPPGRGSRGPVAAPPAADNPPSVGGRARGYAGGAVLYGMDSPARWTTPRGRVVVPTTLGATDTPPPAFVARSPPLQQRARLAARRVSCRAGRGERAGAGARPRRM